LKIIFWITILSYYTPFLEIVKYDPQIRAGCSLDTVIPAGFRRESQAGAPRARHLGQCSVTQSGCQAAIQQPPVHKQKTPHRAMHGVAFNIRRL
jgi:hypothetical protein